MACSALANRVEAGQVVAAMVLVETAREAAGVMARARARAVLVVERMGGVVEEMALADEDMVVVAFLAVAVGVGWGRGGAEVADRARVGQVGMKVAVAMVAATVGSNWIRLPRSRKRWPIGSRSSREAPAGSCGS